MVIRFSGGSFIDIPKNVQMYWRHGVNSGCLYGVILINHSTKSIFPLGDKADATVRHLMKLVAMRDVVSRLMFQPPVGIY